MILIGKFLMKREKIEPKPQAGDHLDLLALWSSDSKNELARDRSLLEKSWKDE